MTTDSHPVTQSRLRGQALLPFAFVVGLWILLHGLTAAIHGTPVLEGSLLGPDSHMRMVRVIDLVESGNWFDTTIERSNAPYGETLHWTRPLDVLLLALAVPLLPFLGFREALYWSGVAISPLFQLATAFAFIWAISPQIRRGQWLLPVIALFLQPAALAYSLPGRADHHSLMLFVFVLTVGFALRALKDRDDLRSAALAGAGAGVGLWLSVELLVGTILSLGGLALAWLVAGGARTRQNLWGALGLTLTVALAIVVERPPQDLFTVTYDRISSVHLFLAGTTAVFWLLVTGLESGRLGLASPLRRSLLGGLGAVACAALLYLFFPAFYAGPMAQIDPRIIPIWHEKVVELRPVIPDSLERLGEFVYYFGLGLFAAPFAAWLLVKERDRPQWLGWACLALGIAVIWPIAVVHVRFAVYAEVLFIMVLAELLDRLLLWASKIENDVKRGLVRGLTAATVLTGSTGVDALLSNLSGSAEARTTPFASEICDLPAIAGHLENHWPEDRRLTVLAFINFGPELLYYTRHRVIATPYHRNGDGIYDGYHLVAGSDAAQARTLMAERGVDLLLLCPGSPEGVWFSGPNLEQSVYGRIRGGSPPAWLEPLPLPAPLSAQFELYQVSR